jgi:hypothetical protein
MEVRRVFGRSVGAPLLVALIVALAALAAGSFVEAFRAAPQRHAVVIAPPASTTAVVRPARVQRWIDVGLAALGARHKLAWETALPARGRAASQALGSLYRRLAPMPWRGLHALVTSISGQPGVFDVKIEGRPGGAGPSDRVVAERLLVVGRAGGRLLATGDGSPAGIAHEYFMAFRTPHAIVRDGAVVVFDESWRPLAEELAGDMPQARADVRAVLGVTGDRPIVVFLYSSSAEVTDYLGQTRALEREQFFARLPTTTSTKLWWPTDVGVLASALAPADPWTEHMLAHEVTHTLTWRWFYATQHAPPLLLEGLATAVEGARSYSPLRAEVAAGNKSMPLLATFAKPDLWNGVRMARVTLAYLEGGALVKYLLADWGQATVKRFCVNIADSSLTGAAIKQVVRRDLHVSWDRFYGGWKTYVMTLP